MIYDYILSTGDATISGCNSADLGTNRLGEINNKTANSAGRIFFDTSLAEGDVFMRDAFMMLSLDGQTLFQEPPTITPTTNENFFSIKSGDFFAKDSGVSIFEKSRLFFDGVPVKPDSLFSFDIFPSGLSGAFIGTGMNGGYGIGNSLGSGISGAYPAASFGDFHYFLNGQRIYSGCGVQENTFAGATTFVPNFVDGAGIVTSENASSFRATAYPKKTRINEVTGAAADVYGSGFIEKQTHLYLNGVKEHPSRYLELYTGVSLIKTGVSAAINDLGRNAVIAHLKL
tara:strand:+ start:3055 stop:3912 length:858 start_codon:yes stop_codon:yes gene_type:complete